MPIGETKSVRKILAVGAVLLVWLAACALGFLQAAIYSSTPGESAPAPSRFPSSSSLSLDPQKETLFVFLHPRCPCSQSTVDKLEELYAREARLPALEVVWFIPPNAGAEWTEGDLWTRCLGLKAKMVLDPGGQEARRFGAYTSGHSALYDARGRLLFSGGLTSSRGHSGISDAELALRALMAGKLPPLRNAMTFGCEIVEPGSSKSCPRCH